MDEVPPGADHSFLGPYRIDRVIGRGGMGSVFQAHHGKTGEEVAVKLIAQHVADDPRFRRRFDAEVETLKRLRHPGIVRLIGYGEEKGQLFYSMELVRGQSLQQRIREVKRLGWLAAIEIAIDVCAALKHAHDIGVIHRDLKPANLLLTDGGDVKLVDFGIAKLFGFGEQTLSGSVLGTADYMAPEQAGTGQITPRTDLYAVGSVMYAMMAGRSPFAGKKVTQVIESLKRDRPVPLDLINPDIPEAIVDLVHQLLEKKPSDRPPTALAVMNRLKATRAGLQRDRTVGVGDQTQVGDQSGPTEVNFPAGIAAKSARDDVGVGDTSNTNLTDAIEVADPDGQTNATGSRPRQETVRKMPSMASSASQADNPTLASAMATDQAKAALPASQTRFETVDAEASSSSTWLRDEASRADTSVWVRLLSVLPIVGMVLILVVGAWLFLQAVRSPTADEMHAELAAAEEAGTLSLNLVTIDRFLKTFPDDRRVDQVAFWRDEVTLERTLRRLQAKARSSGGVSQLNPMDQAFVQAMQLRDASGDQVIAKLQAWLSVFGEPIPGEANQLKARMQDQHRQRLTDMVQQQLDRLQDRPANLETDSRLLTLQQRIDASSKWSVDQRRQLLEGIVILYGDSPWAQSVVSDAKRELDDVGAR
ncbi:MAG: serine/threonine-protein kinase [Planctomycetota bacterium]